MKRLTLLIGFSTIIIFKVFAHKTCVCEQLSKNGSVDFEELSMAELADWEFNESFTTASVRGVVGAAYYYCDEEHGLLIVNRHEKNIVYKNVPLNIWFEFRYSESVENFYREQIKYQFIVVQFNPTSPKVGDTELLHNVQ